MSAEGTQEERRLDGVASRRGRRSDRRSRAATSPRAWAAAGAQGAKGCAEVAAAIPKARRGAIHFSFDASAWNTEALFETDFLPLMKLINCNAWEFAGNYPTVGPGITGNTAPDAGLPVGSRWGATRRRTASASSARTTARSRTARRPWAARSRR